LSGRDAFKTTEAESGNRGMRAWEA